MLVIASGFVLIFPISHSFYQFPDPSVLNISLLFSHPCTSFHDSSPRERPASVLTNLHRIVGCVVGCVDLGWLACRHNAHLGCFKGILWCFFLYTWHATSVFLGKAAYQVDHPYPEVPCQEEGIAYRQSESQQVGLLGAGNQEGGFVGEVAYLEAYLCMESVADFEQHFCSLCTNLEGNLACQAAVQSLEEVLEGAAAYLGHVSARYPITRT